MRLVIVLPLVAAALLAGCAAAPPADPYATRPPDGVDSHTVTIGNERVFESPPFGTPGSAIHARVSWNVTANATSHPLDSWIATGSECTNYGTFTFRANASATNVTSAVLDADLPAGVQSCLIVDNTDFAMGKAPAGPDVDITYTIRVWLLH